MEVELVVMASIFVAAILRGVTGVGFAVAAVPSMALVIPPATAVVITVILQCVVGLRDCVYSRGNIDLRSVSILTSGAVIGTPIGAFMLIFVSQPNLRIMISLLIIVGLLAALGWIRVKANSKTALGLGILAGVFSGIAAMPGPPAIAYFIGTKAPAIKARASLMMFFFLSSSIALPALYIVGEVTLESIRLAAISLPALIAGAWIGEGIFSRFDEGGYRLSVVLVMIVAALLSAAKGFAEFM